MVAGNMVNNYHFELKQSYIIQCHFENEGKRREGLCVLQKIIMGTDGLYELI